MKLPLLLLSLLSLSVVLTACSRKPSDPEIRQQAMTTLQAQCMTQLKDMPGLKTGELNQLCTCSAERIVVTLGAAGVRKIVENKDRDQKAEHELGREAGEACGKELLLKRTGR